MMLNCGVLPLFQLAAQAIMFLLASYETTGNTLSFLTYYLSTHLESQRKVQQEVDSVLGGKAPTLNDLPKVTYFTRSGGWIKRCLLLQQYFSNGCIYLDR
jgi:cytochrome P450